MTNKITNFKTLKSKKLRLFLSGGGGAAESGLLDQEFVSSLETKSILYIPVGLVRDLSGYEECYEWVCRTLNAFGRQLDISMWIDFKRKTYQDLRKFSAVYIGGANNSYRLMRLFEDSGFASLLRKFYINGGKVYGGSTGAIIMGKYISVFGEEPVDNYNTPFGFGFVGEYSVFCHYTKQQENKITTFIHQYRSPVVAIPEKSGVVIDIFGRAKVVGNEKAFLFDNQQSKIMISVGESFIL